MSSRGTVIAFFLVLCIGCKPAPKKSAAQAGPSGPVVRATVVTIETTMLPEKKAVAHELVIANGRARSRDELDTWRLFDLQRNQVTFVDDVARTYRTEDLPQLVKGRRAALAAPVAEPLPRAQFAATGAKKSLQGVEATQSVIRVGGYTRELWIGAHPAIPEGLYAAMVAAETPSAEIEPMLRAADEALLAVRGFPLAEHSELPVGNKKLVVDRAVVKIEQRDVPQTLFNVPGGYKDLKAPAARPRSAS